MDTKEKKKARFAKKSRSADMIRRAQKHTKERQEQEARKAKAPTVSYNQPRPFNPRRLAMQLGLTAAVVAAFLLGVSVFFKVEKVVVYGNESYEAWTVWEASGIREGENLMTFGASAACDRIMEELPYVEKVRIGVTLPDTVKIYVTEYDVAYSVEAEDGSWWLITADGRVMEQIDLGRASAYASLEGIRLSNPQAGTQAVAAEETVDDGETRPVINSAADRLKAAQTVMASLEKCDVLGQVASINVENPGDISLWYGIRFQVFLGGTRNMDKKIAWMKDTVDQLEDYQAGTLDLTFTARPDQAVFTPFG